MASIRYRRHPSYYPNTALRFLKWPVALLAVLSFPIYLSELISSPLWHLSFHTLHRPLLGLLVYVFIWHLLLSRRFMGTYFSTFEHELTHAVFAWLTLHRVVGLRVTWNRGGECSFEGSGGGNWLIAIAPYWFPTLLFPIIIAESFTHTAILQYGVGIALGYHLLSTWREIHPQQTDLQKTSFVFAWAFLPSANIAVYHSALAYTFFGAQAALDAGFRPAIKACSKLFSLL